MSHLEDPAGSEDFTLNVRLVNNAPALATTPSADCTSDGCTTTKTVYPC